MDRKMTSIAGIVFSLVFIALFIIMWFNTNNVIREEVNTINGMYNAYAPFDISLFDNRIVTGKTLKNFLEDMQSSSYTKQYKLYGIAFYDDNKIYRTYLHHNSNGSIDGLSVEDA